MLQLGVVEPRQTGHEEKAARITVLGERAPLQHLPLAALTQGDESIIGQVALHRAVDVHAVGLHGGVGGWAPVELHHCAVLQDTAAQLGHGVGGPRHRVRKLRKKGNVIKLVAKTVGVFL